MRAVLDDPSIGKHDKAIEMSDRRKSMRNCDHRISIHQRLQISLDRGLDLRIKGGSRLVEDNDRRILQEDASDRNPLTLAA